MLKTFCCYIDKGDVFFEELFSVFQKDVSKNISGGVLPTINIMKKDCEGSINTIRDNLYLRYPLRPSPCPYGGMRCCGSCVRSCTVRCAMDSYNKCSQVLLHAMNTEGKFDVKRMHSSILAKEVYGVLSNPDTTYERLTSTANAIITKCTNPKVAQALSYYDNKNLKRENHPYSFDYSPEERLWTNPKTGKLRRVVDSQGYIQFIDYPDSGLCAYCLPRNTIDRSRLTKAERIGLGNSFLK